jgi:methanogenic corrinoid protein MtbC1
MSAQTPAAESATQLLARIDALIAAHDRAGALTTALDAVRDRAMTIPQLYVLVLAPLMRLTGARWQTGVEAVWEEHYTTGVVRTIVESLAPVVLERSSEAARVGRTVIIGCPEQEYHDLGPRMLFDRFLLAGYDAHFLGADVPEPEIVAATASLGADTVILSASTHFHRVRLREYADALEAARPGVTVWVGGPAFACGAGDWPQAEVLDANAFLNDLDGADAASVEECDE